MKNLSLLMALILLALLPLKGHAQATPAGAEAAVAAPVGPKAQIVFKESRHDFGTIKQGEKVEYVFEYTNTGQAPLILSNVQTTCGCTASEWSRAPLPPGQTGKLKATFNSAGKMGRQNKVISIFSNAVNPEERVSLVVSIVPADAAPLPDQKVDLPKN